MRHLWSAIFNGSLQNLFFNGILSPMQVFIELLKRGLHFLKLFNCGPCILCADVGRKGKCMATVFWCFYNYCTKNCCPEYSIGHNAVRVQKNQNIRSVSYPF